jgi:hypothetical protein
MSQGFSGRTGLQEYRGLFRSGRPIERDSRASSALTCRLRLFQHRSSAKLRNVPSAEIGKETLRDEVNWKAFGRQNSDRQKPCANMVAVVKRSWSPYLFLFRSEITVHAN